MSTEQEYIARIKELESELIRTKKQKRYGLVWEDKKEDVVERCKHELPVLVADESKTLSDDPSGRAHILIEGDNFHALSVLAYTHAGKVDVIYIDPPYNTGSKDWKYNNDYVDINDTFRHSKWICMMNNRLKIAKKLLKDRWSLICAIDKYEVSTITLLLQELFPEHEIVPITVIHNPSGTQGNNFSYNNEYAIFVFPKWERAISLERRAEENADIRSFINWAKGKTSNYLRESGPNCFYPILVKDGAIVWFWDVCSRDFHPWKTNVVRDDGIIEIYPVTESWEERKWLFSRWSVEDIISELNIQFNKRKNLYEVIRVKTDINYKTVWVDSKFNAKIHWTMLVWKIIGVDFPFPKSLYLVKECLTAIIHDKENAVILDFFAGSGTTGHAVLELNKEDGGNRQFILCTNNENKIAEEVTYPRVRNVIKWYADVEGIPANLRYYRTDFISNDKSIDDLRHKFILRCSEMLQIRESCFDVSVLNGDEYFQVFENKDLVLAILYHPYEIKRLREIISQTEKPIVAYIFSMGMEIFQEELAEYGDQVRIETVPDEILETYKKIFGF